VTIDDWNPTSRQLRLSVANGNRGGLRANGVTIFEVTTSSGVTLQSPATPFDLGSLAIHQNQPFSAEATVPSGVRAFLLRWRGTATSAERPGVFFPVPPANYGQYITKTVRLPQPQPFAATPNSGIAGNRAPAGGGSWEIEMTNSNQSVVIGSPVLYGGVIRNLTGVELFLSDLSIYLQTGALNIAYALDFAEEFLNTGGLIAASGYSGPLVSLTWLTPPPVGSVSVGTIQLTTDEPVSSPTVMGSFASSFMLQRLGIAAITNSVVISWSAEATNLVVQAANSLEDIEWQKVEAPVVQSASENTVAIPVSQAKSFYRLSSP
jgi:hypothetical protein